MDLYTLLEDKVRYILSTWMAAKREAWPKTKGGTIISGEWP
jgi:hypothetical protein